MMDALSIKNLVKSYKGVDAVKGISLNIKPGEFYAFLGPNGAGKTTTIGAITGLVTFQSGAIKVFGKDVVDDYREARKLVGMSPQEYIFDRSLNVKQVLTYQAGLMGVPKKLAHERAEELLKLFDLWEKRKEDWFNLSGGMKRRLSIAKAMVHQPKLLVLDEPTAGLDVELRRDLWKTIREVNKKGVTILLTTHYIEEAQQLADKVAVINKGKIIKVGKKEEFLDMGMRQLIIEMQHLPKIPAGLKKYNPEIKNHSMIFSYQKNQQHTDKILKELLKHEVHIKNITTTDESLEDIFLKLTKK